MGRVQILSLLLAALLFFDQQMTNPRLKQCVEHIETPISDGREYKFVTLSNNLDVLLVHDETTDKAAAALDVHIGSLSDPDDVNGLAHFLEHLLFMGTKKYPSENEYSSYLSAHGGWSNAFTSGEHTNYYFEVAAPHLEGALDRFSQFFIAPLFDDSCTERELNAVCSEHKKNLQVDAWRFFQLEKSLASKHHPFRKFGTGNMETLKETPEKLGINIRETLLQFHEKYYSANVMKLVILGQEPLRQLEEWAVSMFSDIEDKLVSVPVFPSDPYTARELQQLVRVRPIKDLKVFELTFPIFDTREHYTKKPLSYLSHLIGHEGTGSILAFLKAKGWATGLSAGAAHGARGFDLYKISIELTDAGLLFYDQVAECVFSYVGMLWKHKVAQEWVFEEVRAVEAMHFKFKEKSEPAGYVSWIAGQMSKFPAAKVLSGAFLLEEFDVELITRLARFLTPANSRLAISSLAFEFNSEAGWKNERIYGTEYVSVPYTPEQVARWQNALESPTVSELRFPTANEFIPSNFDVPQRESHSGPSHKQPKLLSRSATHRLWHKRDDLFFVPKVNVYIIFQSPFAYFSAKTSVLARLYVDLVKDALNEYAYPADVAGLSYSLESNQEGLLFTASGYSDKLSLLIAKVLEKMKSLAVAEDRFALAKEKLERQLSNFDLEAPYQHAMYYFNYLTQESLWTHQEKLAELALLNSSQVAPFTSQLYDNLFVEALVHGNWDIESSRRVIDNVLQQFGCRSLSPNALMNGKRTLVIRDGSQYVLQLPVHNAGNVNSAIEFVLQVGDPNDENLRPILSLFTQIASEPCFDTLRTKEQLGYLVFSGVRRQPGLLSYRIIIQSERDCDWLEWRIESFLFKMGSILAELSEEDFGKHVQSLRNKLLERNENMASESSKYFQEIDAHTFDFTRRERDAERLLNVKRSQVVDFYHKFICPPAHVYPGGSSHSNSIRRKLSVHMLSQHPDRKLSRAHSLQSIVNADFETVQEEPVHGPPKVDLPEPLSYEFESVTDWIKSHNDFIDFDQVLAWKARQTLSKASSPYKSLKDYE